MIKNIIILINIMTTANSLNSIILAATNCNGTLIAIIANGTLISSIFNDLCNDSKFIIKTRNEIFVINITNKLFYDICVDNPMITNGIYSIIYTVFRYYILWCLNLRLLTI